MKIKVMLFTIVFVFSVIMNNISIYAASKYSWEQEYIDKGYLQEDIYYLAGIISLANRSRSGNYTTNWADNPRIILKDLEDLGSWKSVAWYYFVDWESLEKFVLERKLWDGIITKEEYMMEIKKEEIEAEKEKRRIFLYVGSNKAIVNDTEKVIDEENPETVVFVENDRSYLPVRFLCEEYGGTVNWIEETQTVNISVKDHEISLTIGVPAITVDGEVRENDVAPVLRNGRTFLPLRALVDAVGKYVIYNSGLIVIDDNQDMVWPMKNMEFVEGFSRERFGMFNAN